MQLAGPPRTSSVRSRLRVAACLLLASGVPVLAHADGAPINTLDVTALLYGEKDRARVIEPNVRVTRIYPDGQSFSGQLGIDVITGASPSGALPSGSVQTTTTPSGNRTSSEQGATPLTSFQDLRVSFDGDWTRPFLRAFTSTLGLRVSREKDYRSVGANAKLSVDLMNKLTILTGGLGFNHDQVDPVGGTHGGLGDGTVIPGRGVNPKEVHTAVLGVSRIITRRWIMAVNGSRTSEGGYLTDPYKVISLMDGESGLTVGQVTEQRPSTRVRKDILTTAAYHLEEDVIHASYRYYWDDWGVKSSTADVKYRSEVDPDAHVYVEPHLRYYTQTPADFFTFGFVQGAALPAYATSDYRLGPLRSVTLGATVGFELSGYPGEWTVRAEYIRQYGDASKANVTGVQKQFELFPAVNIGTVVIGYSLDF